MKRHYCNLINENERRLAAFAISPELLVEYLRRLQAGRRVRWFHVEANPLPATARLAGWSYGLDCDAVLILLTDPAFPPIGDNDEVPMLPCPVLGTLGIEIETARRER